MGYLSGEWDEAEFIFFKWSWLQYYDDVKLFGFDCAGGSKVRDKDGKWGGSQVYVSWSCYGSINTQGGGVQPQWL